MDTPIYDLLAEQYQRLRGVNIPEVRQRRFDVDALIEASKRPKPVLLFQKKKGARR